MDWTQAKETFKNMSFPSDVLSAREIAATHILRNESHGMSGYVAKGYLEEFEWYAQYSFCPKCRMVVSKNMQLFNNKDAVAIQRVFIKNGKPYQEE